MNFYTTLTVVFRERILMPSQEDRPRSFQPRRRKHPGYGLRRLYRQDLGYRSGRSEADSEPGRHCTITVLERERLPLGYDLARQEAAHLGCASGTPRA